MFLKKFTAIFKGRCDIYLHDAKAFFFYYLSFDYKFKSYFLKKDIEVFNSNLSNNSTVKIFEMLQVISRSYFRIKGSLVTRLPSNPSVALF